MNEISNKIVNEVVEKAQKEVLKAVTAKVIEQAGNTIVDLLYTDCSTLSDKEVVEAELATVSRILEMLMKAFPELSVE